MFDSMLSFIKDPANREALTWAASLLGGAAVTVGGGIWAVVKFFAKKESGGSPLGQRAENGGVVIGGDAIGNHIVTSARSRETEKP
jgi:hypothetical protein